MARVLIQPTVYKTVGCFSQVHLSFQLTFAWLTGILSAMSRPKPALSRRDFLKLTGLSAGALVLRPWAAQVDSAPVHRLTLPEFPKGDDFGRNCMSGKILVKAKPDVGSASVAEIDADAVVPWLREVTATNWDMNRINQRWVETPQGYIYSGYLQPCRNLPNKPLATLPEGKSGFWAEVTVPYVDLALDNPPARSPSVINQLRENLTPRLYYSQVVWLDQIKTADSGTIMYLFNEDGGRPPGVTGGSYGDLFWAEGAAFRPLTVDDISPIHPDVDPNTKKIKVNLTYQTLSCYEGDKEVYFCRVSTGTEPGSTPLGDTFAIWRKTFSIHMSGGNDTSGYDGPGVSWTSFFVSGGVAIHAAFWHNDFGSQQSHGCVNCAPEDAKWIFRWNQPDVDLDTADITWHDMQGGSTHVVVEQRLF